jgi:hypothetical protein
MNIALALVVAATPLVALAALLSLASRRERIRQQAIAHQVMLTDAIHGELGAIVAPVVTARRRGTWRVRIGMPIGHPGLVAAIVAIVDRRLASRAPGARFEILLTPRDESGAGAPARSARRAVPSRPRAHAEASESWT